MPRLTKAFTFLRETPELIPLVVPVCCGLCFAGFTIVRNLATNAVLTRKSKPFDHTHSKLVTASAPTLGYSPNDIK
eukprot:CFRG6914T1